MSDEWTHKLARPGGRRLRLGIGGPSRSGKTFSSLRIATGLVSVLGGEIFFIDTDNEFALDYADGFNFQHVDFKPPYTSERYQGAIEYCVSQGAGVIVVDQMSHEQTGEGGVLQRQEEVEAQLAKQWNTSRDKVKGSAWNQAKTIPHGKLVSYVTRVKQPMIFNFRAKDKIKIVKDPKTGKQEWSHMGYTAICAEQFDYEMSAMLILPPASDGAPDKEMSEIRSSLRKIVKLGEQCDEGLGKRLADWAKGGAIVDINPATSAAILTDFKDRVTKCETQEALSVLSKGLTESMKSQMTDSDKAELRQHWTDWKKVIGSKAA